MKTTRTRLEQETTVTLNAEEKYALVGSCHEPTLKRLNKMEGIELHRNDGDWITYKVPKEWIKIRPNRKVSDEQRKLFSDRMKARKVQTKAI